MFSMPKPSNKIVFISTLYVSILTFAYTIGLGAFLPHKKTKKSGPNQARQLLREPKKSVCHCLPFVDLENNRGE